MDLERGTLAPGAAEFGERNRGVKQQRAAGARPRVGQHLRRHPAEREPGIDKLRRQALGRGAATLQDRVEADLSGVVNALVDRVEGLAVVEIRRVNDVPSSPELVGERDNPGSQALRVVEEQHLGHGGECSRQDYGP